MTDIEKNEIRKLIREEIEARLSGRPVLTVLRDAKEHSQERVKDRKVVNIETVSPAY